LCCFAGVAGGEGDDRRHDDAPVVGQLRGGGGGAFLVAEAQADMGFEFVG
jgi:hypothetical protein